MFFCRKCPVVELEWRSDGSIGCNQCGTTWIPLAEKAAAIQNAAAEEREACAKIVELNKPRGSYPGWGDAIAAKIRARIGQAVEVKAVEGIVEAKELPRVLPLDGVWIRTIGPQWRSAQTTAAGEVHSRCSTMVEFVAIDDNDDYCRNFHNALWSEWMNGPPNIGRRLTLGVHL